MVEQAVTRQVFSDGSVKLAAGDCSFVYTRPMLGRLLVTIAGSDTGQFGTSTLDEIVLAVNRERPLELFVDAQEAKGATVSVSQQWTHFFSAHRADLRAVHVLVGSKALTLTIAIAQHFSRTGNLIQLYSNAEIFKSRLNAR